MGTVLIHSSESRCFSLQVARSGTPQTVTAFYGSLSSVLDPVRCRITARTSLGRTATFKIGLICVAPMMPRPSGSPSNSLMVATWSYGNWIDRSGRSRHTSWVSEIALYLPFSRLDSRLGLRPELQVAACGTTVLLPEFSSAGFDLFIGPPRGRTLPQALP